MGTVLRRTPIRGANRNGSKNGSTSLATDGTEFAMPLLDQSYISYINLDHRTDRRAHMERTLGALGINAIRTRGMLPSEYKGDPAKIRCMLSRPQKGAIGCHFSQVSIMEEAARQGKHAFVMEDDLVFCSDFHKRLAILEEFCSGHPWDVLWLGGTYHINPPWWHKNDLGRDAEQTYNPRVMRTYGAFSTHAYIVNRESIVKCLTWIDEILPLSMGIDWAFIQLEPHLYTYAFVPGCVIQFDNQSDIGKGVTVFSGFKKLGPHWFADKMEDFDPSTYDWHEARRRI